LNDGRFRSALESARQKLTPVMENWLQMVTGELEAEDGLLVIQVNPRVYEIGGGSGRQRQS